MSLAVPVYRTIEIDSGNNQRTDGNGEVPNPLVVVVKRSGKRVMNVPVTFTTTAINGLLEGFAWTDTDNDGVFDSGETNASTSLTTQTLTTLTNSSGEAEVEFFLSDGSSGGAQVVARISGTVGSPAVPYARNVTFGINGGGSSGGGGDDRDDEDDEDDEDDTTTGRTITINPPTLSLTGRPGVVVPLGVLARTGTIDTPVTVTGKCGFHSGGWHGHRFGCDSGRYTSECDRGPTV